MWVRGCDSLLVSAHCTATAAGQRRWGMFRDRRPDLYGALATLDGSSNTRR